MMRTDFNNINILDQFETERQKILGNAVNIGAILAASLVPVFSFLDLVLKPHIIWPFLSIRFGVTVTALLIFYLCKTPFGKKYPYFLGAFLTLIVGSSISLMCRLDMGPSDPYYAGINLPLLGFGILLPLTLGEGIIVFGLVWLSYFIPNILIIKTYEIPLFISNNFFLISTIIISLVSSQFFLYQRRKQWYTHKRLESAHKKIKRHALELEEEVKERTQKLLQSERLAVVGQLAGGIAHDFNNILTVILGNSELLLYTMPKDDPYREDIEGISRIGKRASDLVKKLLAFSRRQILVPKKLNLNNVIIEIKEMLKRVLGEDIEMVFDMLSGLQHVHADPIQIEQIILNLCVNARDAMPNGGKLILETNNVSLDQTYCNSRNLPLTPGEYVMLAISDTGIGMSEEIRTKIFEPFFTTKEKGNGTGLGLSSVYGIVKQSNGDILVYSEEGKGTVFKIFLPCVNGKVKKTTSPEKKEFDLAGGNETILLVEDEDEVRRLTARMLRLQGYTVMEAPEGNTAIAIAEKHRGHIDLLLTDVIMPRMNGKVLAEELRKKQADLKVLFLSGYTNTMMELQGVITPETAFLQKPYTSEILTQTIRNIIDRPNGKTAN